MLGCVYFDVWVAVLWNYTAAITLFDTIWQARLYEQPCSSVFRCIWGNKTVTTPLPDIVTTTKLPDTTTPKSTTTKLPYTTPKPNPVNYGGTILWVFAFLGGFVLIGAMVFLIFKNYRRITLRNRTITPSGWENRFSALIGTIKKFHNQFYNEWNRC